MPSQNQLEDDQSVRVVIYHRDGCECVASARKVLESCGLNFELQRVEEHSQLAARHPGVSPLVEIDGRVRFLGKVDPVLLKRILNREPTTQTERA